MNIILADGRFPSSQETITMLKNAKQIICCDGAADKLLAFGIMPNIVIGDLDSISPDTREQLKERLIKVEEQESNDLAKAFSYCMSQGLQDVCILGATGGREDHTLGNISLLADFAKLMPNIKMFTDHGIFFVAQESGAFSSFAGQQISIFSFDPEIKISSAGLKYPLNSLQLRRWWQASLNEASGDSFSLDFSGGTLIIFATYHAKGD